MIAGTLEIQLMANLARLSDDMSKARKVVGDAMSEISSSVSTVKGLLASIGVGVSIAGFASLVHAASESGDAAAKMGDRFGIATEQIVSMEHASRLAGGSGEGLSNALKNLAKSGADAATQGGQTWQAFQRLGIVAQDFVKLPMAEQLSTVIDRLHNMENATTRNATAQTIFNRSIGDVAGLIAEGSEAFKKAREDTEAWGLAINRIDAAKLEIMNDQMKRVEDATKGVFTQIALNLSPVVAKLAKDFADATASAKGYREEVVEGTSTMIEVVGYFANILRGLQYTWETLKYVVSLVAGAVVESFAEIAEVATKIIELGTKLPGSMGEWAKAAHETALDVTNAAKDLAASLYSVSDETLQGLDALVAEGLPHDRVVKWFADAKKEMAKGSAELAAEREKFAGLGGGDTGLVPFDAYQAGLANQLAALIQHNKDSLQVIEETARQRQAILNEAREKELITDDYWQGQSMLVFAHYQDERALAIYREQEQLRQKNQAVTNMEMQTWQLAASFLQVFAGKSKAAAIAVIAIQKALAIAQVIQQTAVASMAAFAPPPIGLGPALGGALAAQIQALGAVQIALIAATGIAQAAGVGSGGASIGTPANPVVTTPSAPSGPIGSVSPAPSQTIVNVTITGVVTNEVVDQLMDGLRDVIDNRDGIIIGKTSRQARNLRDPI